MRLLVVGGAGYVATILRPTLEAEHECRYVDLRPVPGAENRCIVGDVNHEAVVNEAIQNIDSVVWLAMGVRGEQHTCNDLDIAFDVNVRGFYRLLAAAARAGIRRFVYTSTLSVYEGRKPPLDESVPPNAWHPYGFTKRLGEVVGETLAQRYPDATFLSLRLMWPRNEQDFPVDGRRYGNGVYALGPNDLRRAFLASIAFSRPGAYAVQITGDVEGAEFPYAAALALLGWRPEGK